MKTSPEFTFASRDDTGAEILSRLHEANITPQKDAGIGDEWDITVATLGPWHSLRILTDLLSEHPMPYFYAAVLGSKTGPFDALVDERRAEQVVLEQPKTVDEKMSYDFWTSFARAHTAGTRGTLCSGAIRAGNDGATGPGNFLDKQR